MSKAIDRIDRTIFHVLALRVARFHDRLKIHHLILILFNYRRWHPPHHQCFLHQGL